MAESPSCIFCRIARGEIPTKMVANGKDIVAFRDLNPQAPVHILVIPKKHVASLDDASDADLLGRDGGQSVDHLHIHLLGGRHMTWPPG